MLSKHHLSVACSQISDTDIYLVMAGDRDNIEVVHLQKPQP
jgi:hypothetical protein